MSCCFNSSRLKMISFLGRYSLSITDTNFLPKEPVPPVTRTVLSFQFIGCEWAVSAGLTKVTMEVIRDPAFAFRRSGGDEVVEHLEAVEPVLAIGIGEEPLV